MPAPIKVVSPEEAEACDFVVLAKVGEGYGVPGWMEVPCSVCGTACMLAPSSPAKPPKICIPCMVKRQRAVKVAKVEASQQSFSA